MKKRESNIGRIGAALAAISVVGAASAQDAGVSGEQADPMVEEIVVTAQKRSQNIQDVAASISAIGAADLDARGIKDMTDIQFFVPSLHFGGQFGEQNIAIRGVGAFARQPGVSVSIDGVYQSRTSAAQLYQLDLERVEVLRGPQGTLYGRNSNGGVVNFITAAPCRAQKRRPQQFWGRLPRRPGAVHTCSVV